MMHVSALAILTAGLFSLLMPSAAAMAAVSVGRCTTWAPNSVLNITVDGLARFDAAGGCGSVLVNVSVTFFVMPQSTIVLEGWTTRGGNLAIQGPPSAPWSLTDVAIIVTNSAIEAVDGPAVGVVLGAGYNITQAPLGIEMRNVSLYCANSQLSSSGSPVASVASVTFDPTLTSSHRLPNVTIAGFTAVVVDCALRSFATCSPNATAAVASITAAQYGSGGGSTAVSVVVSNILLYLLRSNATVVSEGEYAVSSVAGIAFASLLSVVLTVSASHMSVLNCATSTQVRTCRSGTHWYAASTTAGVAVSDASRSAISTVNKTTLNVGASSVSTGASAPSTSKHASVGASIAGIAVGNSWTSPVTIANTTFSVNGSTATTSSTNYSAILLRWFAGSTIGGVAVGYASEASPVSAVSETFFNVAWCNASISCAAAGGNVATSASSVAGVAVGCAELSSVTIADGAVFGLFQSNVTGAATASESYGFAVSSVAGVAVGSSRSSPITARNITLYVAWSTVTISTSSASGSSVSCSSTVGGVAVGKTSWSAVATSNSAFWVGWSTTTTRSSATSNYGGYVGASIAGVAVGSTTGISPVSIDSSTTFYVGWCNATSNISAIGAPSFELSTASSVAGVAVGSAERSSGMLNGIFYLGWSSVSCTSSAAATTHAGASSCVACVAIGPPSSALSTLSRSVTSHAFLVACVEVRSSNTNANAAVGCATKSNSSTASISRVCCDLETAPNTSFPSMPVIVIDVISLSPVLITVPPTMKGRRSTSASPSFSTTEDPLFVPRGARPRSATSSFAFTTPTLSRRHNWSLTRRVTTPTGVPNTVAPPKPQTTAAPPTFAPSSTTATSQAKPPPPQAPVLRPELRSAHQGVTATASVAAVVLPMAADFATGVQTLSLLDALPCGVDTTAAPIAMVPLTLGNGRLGEALGLVVPIAAAAAACMAALALVALSSKKKATLWERMATVRFPGVAMSVSVLTLQGLGFIAAQGLSIDGDGDRTGGAVAAAVVALIFAVHFVALLALTRERRWTAEPTPPLERVPAVLRWAVALGAWAPSHLARHFGPCYAGARDGRVLVWLAMRLGRPAVMGIIAGVPVSGAGCDAKQWCLAAICALHSVALVALAPNRVAVTNAPAALCSLLTAAAFVCRQQGLPDAAAQCGTAVLVVSGLGVALVIVIAVVNTRYRVKRRARGDDITADTRDAGAGLLALPLVAVMPHNVEKPTVGDTTTPRHQNVNPLSSTSKAPER